MKVDKEMMSMFRLGMWRDKQTLRKEIEAGNIIATCFILCTIIIAVSYALKALKG